ncbi:MAG: N4-gp56 family major capsid protein [Clostridia bacterium]|nr:N4-gp56 family major capsid protein [Clostridia bacterium]
MNILKLNLRLFDLNINKTTALPAEIKTYYSDYLIDNAKPNLVHDQFGQKHNIPKNGGKSISFRRFMPFDKATLSLSEGITPTGGTLSVTEVTSTLQEYGFYIALSDMLMLTSIDNTILETTKLLGNQAGATLDTITRDIINSGTNVMYSGGVSSRSSITEECKLTVDDIYKAARFLKSQNAPKIDGAYVAIIHPDIAYDLMRDPEWIEVNKYNAATKLFEGEIGKLAGVRFVETSEARTFTTSTLKVYSTMIIGANAYGVTEVSGGGLRTIIKQLGSSGAADPLDQRASVGWKATRTAERLVENYMIRIESASTFSV